MTDAEDPKPSSFMRRYRAAEERKRRQRLLAQRKWIASWRPAAWYEDGKGNTIHDDYYPEP